MGHLIAKLSTVTGLQHLNCSATVGMRLWMMTSLIMDGWPAGVSALQGLASLSEELPGVRDEAIHSEQETQSQGWGTQPPTPTGTRGKTERKARGGVTIHARPPCEGQHLGVRGLIQSGLWMIGAGPTPYVWKNESCVLWPSPRGEDRCS